MILDKTLEICEEVGIVLGALAMGDAFKLDRAVRLAMLAGYDLATSVAGEGEDLGETRAALAGALNVAP